MNYFDAFDPRALARDYPVEDLLQQFQSLSRDELRARQEARCSRRTPSRANRGPARSQRPAAQVDAVLDAFLARLEHGRR